MIACVKKKRGRPRKVAVEQAVAGEDLGELVDPSENYCDLMLRVREAAAERGLTFREVMSAMAKRVLASLKGKDDKAMSDEAGNAVIQVRVKRPGALIALIAATMQKAAAPLSAGAIYKAMGGTACGSTLNCVTVTLITTPAKFERIVVSEASPRRVLWKLKEEEAADQRG
jgi:hypothetical protein